MDETLPAAVEKTEVATTDSKGIFKKSLMLKNGKLRSYNDREFLVVEALVEGHTFAWLKKQFLDRWGDKFTPAHMRDYTSRPWVVEYWKEKEEAMGRLNRYKDKSLWIADVDSAQDALGLQKLKMIADVVGHKADSMDGIQNNIQINILQKSGER